MREEVKARLDRTIMWIYQTELRHASYPVTPLSVIMRMQNCKIRSYQQLATDSGTTVSEVIRAMRSADGCTNYQPIQQRYLISYNKDGRSKARIQWTLSHELGHILSGHFVELYEDGKTAASPSELQYMEEEADYFAANFLAPLPSIYALKAQTAADVRDWFGLSQTAAEYRWAEYLRSETPFDTAENYPYLKKASAVKNGRHRYHWNHCIDLYPASPEDAML